MPKGRSPMFLKRWFVAVIILVSTSALAQQDFSSVTIKTTPVAKGIYMLEGSGGNIGLVVGDQGAFIIDAQYAPLTEKIQAAISEITDKPVRILLNTHWHSDHTGGNENFANSGAIIVAHENVRKRLGGGQHMAALGMDIPPAAPKALPALTFTGSITFHWNGEPIEVFHPQTSHTDGDVAIFFKNSNTVHTGDLFFNGTYPFIDADSGASIDSYIAGIDAIMARMDDSTKIIPGHGPLSNKTEYKTFREMLATIRDRMKALVKEGKTVDEIVAAKPTADFDAVWGKGFMNPDQWVRMICPMLKD